MSQRPIRLISAILIVGATLCHSAGRMAVRAAEIRKLPGKHVTLYTDLPSSPAVDALPEMFDQAFPQWCAYFGVDAAQHAAWHATGCMMKDADLFRSAGLLPGGLPPFTTGYSVGTSFWVYEQASDYYRAHLFLHEGTHAFVNTIPGRGAPPWYMEGMAELLGTHRWRDGRLTLGYFPASPDEVPMWGRIRIVRDDFAARRAKTLRGVFEYGPQAHREVGPYGWCWAAAVFLDRHPRYQERFRQLTQWTRDPDLTDRFVKLIGNDWDELAEEWQVFVADLEYGYDFQRTAIDFASGQRLPQGGAKVAVAADRGWQNSGLRLESGVTYRLQASGRYQVGREPQVWWCEPNGVSIRYWRGQPLGILLAAVRPHPEGTRPEPNTPSALIRPSVVGLGADLTPKHSGTLFLRINDSAGELGKNAGKLTVEVREKGLGARD
jgi:hypothetical protein